MLASDLVGWDVIDGYDELMLANDSCYLVQPLRPGLRQDGRDRLRLVGTAGDLRRLRRRATSSGSAGRWPRRGRASRCAQLDLWRYSDFIHVGSYFLAYRRRVHRTTPSSARGSTTSPRSRDKTTIILKYEIGFSRLLILAGYHLATFVDGILPYHPVYRASAFDLMRDGFPLLKRQFLYENPFSAPDLRRWKERVLETVARRRRRGDGAQPAPGRAGRGACSAASASARGRDGTVEPPQAHRARRLRRRGPLGAHAPALVGLPGRPAHRRAVRCGPRGLRGGPRRPVDQEDRAPGLAGREGRRRQRRRRAQRERHRPDVRPARRHRLHHAGPRGDVNHPLSAAHHRSSTSGAPPASCRARRRSRGSGASGTAPPTRLRRPCSRAVVASGHAGRRRRWRPARARPRRRVGDRLARIDLLLGAEDTLSAPLRAELAALRSVVAGRRVVVVSPLSATARTSRHSPAWADDHGTSPCCGPCPARVEHPRCRRRWSTCTTPRRCARTPSPRTRCSPRWRGASPTSSSAGCARRPRRLRRAGPARRGPPGRGRRARSSSTPRWPTGSSPWTPTSTGRRSTRPGSRGGVPCTPPATGAARPGSPAGSSTTYLPLEDWLSADAQRRLSSAQPVREPARGWPSSGAAPGRSRSGGGRPPGGGDGGQGLQELVGVVTHPGLGPARRPRGTGSTRCDDSGRVPRDDERHAGDQRVERLGRAVGDDRGRDPVAPRSTTDAAVGQAQQVGPGERPRPAVRPVDPGLADPHDDAVLARPGGQPGHLVGGVRRAGPAAATSTTSAGRRRRSRTAPPRRRGRAGRCAADQEVVAGQAGQPTPWRARGRGRPRRARGPRPAR